MVRAFHTPGSLSRTILQGTLEWVMPWTAVEMLDGQHQRVNFLAHARSTVHTRASCRNDWKGISAESALMFPRWPSRSWDWNELWPKARRRKEENEKKTKKRQYGSKLKWSVLWPMVINRKKKKKSSMLEKTERTVIATGRLCLVWNRLNHATNSNTYHSTQAGLNQGFKSFPKSLKSAIARH